MARTSNEERHDGGRFAGLPWAVLAAVAVLAFGALVAGCGDDEGTTTTAQTTTETTEAEEEAGGEEEGGAAAGGEEEAGAGNAKAGAQVFADNCAACHGEDGSGGVGPDLRQPTLAQESERVMTQVIEGGGGMPAFGEQLSEEEVADVVAYVVEDLAGG